MPLLLLLLLPLIEIALFIAIGGRLGLWPVLALVVLGALSGVLILRGQRERAEAMMRGGLRNVSPGSFLAQGAFRLVGALLLILPGFLTDALGLILLLPPVQRALMRALALRVRVETVHSHNGDIVEGDFTVNHEGPAPQPGDHRLGDHRLSGPHSHRH